MLSAKSKSILMFFPWNGTHPQDAFAGVRGEAAARHWDFHSAETVRADDGTSRLHRSSRSASSVSSLVELLRPDGIIVWEDALFPSEVSAATGDSVPAVFVDCGAGDEVSGRLRFGRVRSDPGSIAALAARVLLSSKYGDFAFVPNGVPLPWSVERGTAFEHCIDVAGRRFHRFNRVSSGKAAEKDAESPLERWLEALPKPCGIFAANDAVGEEVLGACAHIGIPVPDDVAVMGVDNHEYFCESTTPTLSSIALDLRAEGRAAVELLDILMAAHGKKRPARPTRFVPARASVLRASTRFARDRRVARALEFIRLNACAEKFGPRDVVREMGVSRTLADKLFRTVVGQTMLEEIHAVRLARARELLAAGNAPYVVGAECGYASHDDFRRVFRKRIGTTIRKWTMAHAWR